MFRVGLGWIVSFETSIFRETGGGGFGSDCVLSIVRPDRPVYGACIGVRPRRFGDSWGISGFVQPSVAEEPHVKASLSPADRSPSLIPPLHLSGTPARVARRRQVPTRRVSRRLNQR
jgi:hypothetical protein